MQTPPTWEEATALASAVVDGRAGLEEVRSALDVDGSWFARCSIDELDPADVEVVVRWAMRQYVAIALNGIAIDAMRTAGDGARELEVDDMSAFVVIGTPDERGLAEAATRRLLEELRAINREE